MTETNEKGKPVCLDPVLRNKRRQCSEKPTHQNEEQPPFTTTRESSHEETKTQHKQK